MISLFIVPFSSRTVFYMLQERTGQLHKENLSTKSSLTKTPRLRIFTYITQYIWYGKVWFGDKYSTTKVKLPWYVNNISQLVFHGCTNIISLPWYVNEVHLRLVLYMWCYGSTAFFIDLSTFSCQNNIFHMRFLQCSCICTGSSSD